MFSAARSASVIYNRNPRSLEKICIGYKPAGWILEKPGRNYWNKLILERTNRHVMAYVKHYTGAVPVTASTKEWAIRRHLFSSEDRSAYVNLARVFAQRCIQSGISEMFTDLPEPEGEPKTNAQFFRVELVNSGLCLTEPPQYKNPRPSDTIQPKERPWEIFE